MPEKYIFNWDTQDLFYEKLESFHDKFVHHLLLSGVAPKGTDLESIKMTKSPKVSGEYCERVVGGLVNLNPEVIVRLVEDGVDRLECIITRVDDGQNLNYIYMIQNVMDWPQIGNFSCQVWYLGEASVKGIKEHWYE